MAHVEKNEENLKHCRCPICPVEYHSKCSRKKLEHELADDPIEVLERKTDVAKLYCAMGKTDCDDMETSENCKCPTCLVWDQNDLSARYYCVRGSADKNG